MNSDGTKFLRAAYADGRARRSHWLAVMAGILLLAISFARGAGLTEVCGLTGTYSTTLIQGMDGNFYGTTPVGGQYNLGAVFEWNTNGTFTILASFDITNGIQPNGLVQAADGSFYGTAFFGGTIIAADPYGYGTAYKIDPSGTFSTLFAFPYLPGRVPESAVRPNFPLIQGLDGNLYGLSSMSAGPGGLVPTLFEIPLTGSPFTVANFNNAYPDSPLTQGADGSFYCTAGPNLPDSFGALIQIHGSGQPNSFYSFTDPSVGSNPQGGLLPAPDGSLYGVTEAGGADGAGTVFNVTTNGLLTSLVSFNWANGASPQGGLVFGSDDNLYGTTTFGGTDGIGTVFMMSADGTLTTLGSFDGTNGAYPVSALIPGNDGNLYGATPTGGANGTGTIFQLPPGGTPRTIASFPGFNGASAWGDLITGADGNFYGTTYGGGTYDYGTVFKLTTNGLVTMLYSFGGTVDPNDVPLDGGDPEGALFQGADGSLYGTTSRGGTNDSGTIFKLAPDGSLTTLVSFNDANGSNPQAGVTIGTDGNFYGTTMGGGLYENGTVFKFATNGTLTTLFSFTNSDSSAVLTANGFRPSAGLTRGSDGNFYGVTESTAFQISPSGLLTNLAVFGGANGATPLGGLTFGSDGNLYGTTAGGGAANSGTVFQLSTNGTLTTLLSFQRTNGSTPCGRLIQGFDGDFYGTTRGGAISNNGTVFRISTNGALNILATFNYTNGANPVGGLTLGTDGNLYGMTVSGGSGTRGNLFQIPLRPSPRVTVGTGPTLTLTWNTISGLTYQVQSSPSLSPANWTNFGPPVQATSGILTTSDSVAAGERFYRVVLLP